MAVSHFAHTTRGAELKAGRVEKNASEFLVLAAEATR
jgi:hypothetical protein